MVWYFVIVFATLYWLYIERIMAAEEKYLAHKFGDTFQTWARGTPAFIPRLALWIACERSARISPVLKKEYYGPFVVSTAFLALECTRHVVVGDYTLFNWLQEKPFFPLLFVCSLGLLCLLRWMKKCTTLLNGPVDRSRDKVAVSAQQST